MIPKQPEQPTAKGWIQCKVGELQIETSWNIEAGRIFVLFGRSGAGKSTILRAIAGLLSPVAGHVEIGGVTVYDSGDNVWVPTHERQLGYLTQQYHLFPHLTVASNMSFGLKNDNSDASKERITYLSNLFQLDGLNKRYPWELSGGEQQRVALARALATDPGMLLLDEPFASLDAALRRNIRQEIRSMLVRSPIPVMLVTHDHEEALALGDSVQVLEDGHPLVTGDPLDVLGQPGQGRVARLMGVENLFELNVLERNSHDGTMTCVGSGMELEVPLDANISSGSSYRVVQDKVTVGIRASDIILSRQDLLGSSARNRLPGQVISIESRPPGFAVTLDCGQTLKCNITGISMEEMNIHLGQTLWAVFKASSCFLVDVN